MNLMKVTNVGKFDVFFSEEDGTLVHTVKPGESIVLNRVLLAKTKEGEESEIVTEEGDLSYEPNNS
jgi:hypothetical protein